MGFISIIIHFFRVIGVRNLLIFILAVIVFFFVKKQFFTKSKDQVQVTSLFQKIEYVEQLRLVTYYYEEIVAIGTSDRMQQLVERAKEQVTEGERIVIVKEILRDSLKAGMEAAIVRYNSADENLKKFEDAYFSARDTLEHFDLPVVNPFDKIRWKLDSANSWYGPEVAASYRQYKAAETVYNQEDNIRKARNTTRDRKRQANDTMDAKKREMKEVESKMLDQIKLRRERLRENLESKKSILQEMQKQSETFRKDLKKVKDKAIKVYQQAEKDVLDARGDLEKRRLNLVEAEGEMLKRQGEPLPKLLFIVSVEVTGMVDLKELDFETEHLVRHTGGDSMVMFVNKMPVAKLDSVVINLSDTKRFQTGGNAKNGLFSKEEEGMYYEVYQQMKDALAETEQIAKNKAIEAGILIETDKLALDYIRGIGKSMGFFVTLPGDLPPQLDKPAITNVDSTQIMADSMDKVFTVLSNCAFLQDTIASIIQSGDAAKVRTTLRAFISQINGPKSLKDTLSTIMRTSPSDSILKKNVYQFLRNLKDCSFLGDSLEEVIKQFLPVSAAGGRISADYTASTDLTSGTIRVNNPSIPFFRVIVEDGQPEQLPCRRSFRIPSSKESKMISPPSVATAGRT